jgi:hypothetical protein
MSIIRAFGFDPGTPEWDFMNDGLLSPERERAPADYFRFSIVRNPWDRFVSGWRYLPSTRDRALRDVLGDLPREGHDFRHLTRPQHLVLVGNDGRIAVDYLMRFETLQGDFDQVCEIVGKPRATLPHENRGERLHYSAYFDANTRRMFLRQFALDVELFEYVY